MQYDKKTWVDRMVAFAIIATNSKVCQEKRAMAVIDWSLNWLDEATKGAIPPKWRKDLQTELTLYFGFRLDVVGLMKDLADEFDLWDEIHEILADDDQQ